MTYGGTTPASTVSNLLAKAEFHIRPESGLLHYYDIIGEYFHSSHYNLSFDSWISLFRLMITCWIAQIDLDFNLKYSDTGDFLAVFVSQIVDPLLRYGISGGCGPGITSIAAAAQDKPTGF